MSKSVETARGTVHRWQCDHMGHVNVRAYGERFEEACWQFYAMLGLKPSRLRSGAFCSLAESQAARIALPKASTSSSGIEMASPVWSSTGWTRWSPRRAARRAAIW